MEKAPTKLEETIEEGIHLVCRNNFCEKREIPVSCKNFNTHTDLLEVLIKIWQVVLHELCDQCAVLDVTW